MAKENKKEGRVTEIERAEIESTKELTDSIPKVALYGGIAFLIWVFTTFVFAPLGRGYLIGGFNTAQLIAVIGIVAILILILKVLREIKDIANAIGGLIALKSGRAGASPEELEHWRAVIRGILYVIVVAVIFTFFASLLVYIHPALAGIVLVIVFLWVVFTLYRSGMAISTEIEVYSREKSKVLLKKAAQD